MFGIGSILVPWVQSPVLNQYQSDFDSSTEISQNSSVLTASVLEDRHPMFLIFLLLPSSLQFLEGS